jgi:hypothetical protein
MLGAFAHRSKSRRNRRRANHRHEVRRPCFEALEDRLTLSFAYWGALPPVEFNQITGPDAVIAGVDPTTNQLWLDSADFNADGWNDLVRVTLNDPGYAHLGEIFLSRTDGTLDYPLQFDPGPDPRLIATGDFAVVFDGRADFAIYHYYGFDENGVFGTSLDAWYVYHNMGNWPVVDPDLPGDYNDNGTVDAADYVMWRKTLGTSMPNYSGPDGNGNGVVDQDDHEVWSVHFGQTSPAGAGSLVAAAPATPEPATAALFGAGLVAMSGIFFHRSQLRRTRQRANRRHAVRQPRFEPLENRCLLSFTPAASYAVGGAPIGMQSGDFNGDGIPDLATANSGGGVSVLLSNGDGTFQPARSTSTTEWPSLHNAPAVGDFNQDGMLDLATSANGPGNIGFNVLLGRGDGTFVNAAPSDVFLGWTSSIITGGLNGDGMLDLVLAADDLLNGATYVRVLNGQGDGTFSQSGLYVDGPAESYSLAMADFDGDIQLDLVLGGSFTTWVILRTSDGYFQAPRDLGLVAESLTVADFNADGKPDLAATSPTSEINVQTVSVLLGNGDGSFQTARSFTAARGSVAAADVNNDGALDLVSAGGSVLLGTGDGNFGPPITTAGTGVYLVVADFNADGRPDEAMVKTTSNTVSVLLNDGIWPVVGPALPGDYNGNDVVDSADYVVWRKSGGTQADYNTWRAHFGESTGSGEGSSVAAAPAPLPALAQPDEGGANEPQGASERDAAFAALDSQLPAFIPQGKATLRRPVALPISESGMKARGNDLLLVRSTAAELDEYPSERGHRSRLISDSTEEAVETRRMALDIAFTTLNRAGWHLGGDMFRRVWAGLSVGLVSLALQS